MNRRLAAIIGVGVAAVGVVLFFSRGAIRETWRTSTAPELPAAVSWQEVKPEVVEVEEEVVVEPITGGVPAPRLETEQVDEPVSTPVPVQENTEEAPVREINLTVPFTSQAPFGVWDEMHEETCEEAAVFMVVRYYQGATQTVIDPAEADQELYRLVALEESIGMGLSISAEQTKRVIEAAYPTFRAELVFDPTVDDLKALLAAGHPVVVPTAGRELGNPNFSGEGPLYHMYVLRGYTEDGFISNDPGTRLGREYFYSTSVVMDAIRDWNHGDVYSGARVVIVIYPR